MAKNKDGHWMERVFSKNPGALHRELGVKEGRKIPAKKLKRAEKSRNPTTKKRAVAAETARKIAARHSR